jgi:hypothetical protein
MDEAVAWGGAQSQEFPQHIPKEEVRLINQRRGGVSQRAVTRAAAFWRGLATNAATYYRRDHK